MSFKKSILSFCTPLFFCLISLSFLQAQPTSCYDFQNIELDQKFGRSAGNEPGDIIPLVGDDAITTLLPFQYPNNEEPGFWDVTAVNWDFFNDNGFSEDNHYLFISNINLNFDFSQQADIVSQVSFDFADGGGEENIGVNGHTLHVLNYLQEAPQEIAPGVSLEILLDTLTDISRGTVFLYGKIESFIIGGQELGFDNLCITVNDVAPLCIDNVKATPTPCTPNGVFYTEISFDYNNPASDSFFIRGNGQNYGQFAYGQSEYKIGPIEAEPNLNYEFVIIDAADDNCSNYAEIGSISCNDNDCKIYDLWARTTPCQTDEKIDLYFGFSSKNTNQAGFDVSIDGKFIKFFRFDELADSIGYQLSTLTLNPGVHKLTICGNDTPECCNTIEFIVENCNQQGCRVFNVQATASDCKDNRLHDITIDFDHEALTGKIFELAIAGEKFDSLSLDNLPITIKDLRLVYEYEELEICVYQSSSPLTTDIFQCCIQEKIKVPNCENDSLDCAIYSVFAEAHPCQDDGSFYVDVEFKVENPTTTKFEIRGNGTEYGVFEYGKPFYTVGPVQPNERGIYEFIIIDAENKECKNEYVLTNFDCRDTSECKIQKLTAETSNCKEDGTIVVEFNFNHDLAQDSLYKVFIDRSFVQYVGYVPENGYRIPDLTLSKGEHQLTICSSIEEDCCETIVFEAPDCDNFSETDCKIYDIQAEALPCDVDGSFMLDFNFNVENPVGTNFLVFINDEPFQEFPYGQGVYSIGPIFANDIGRYQIVIKDSENNTCQGILNFENFDCINTEDCQMRGLETDISKCRENGTVDIKVNFEFENPVESGFNVFIDEEYIETYGFHQLPFVLNGMDFSSGEHRLSICSNDSLGCCISSKIIIPECGTCSITNVSAIVEDCSNEDFFSVELKFDVENPSSNRFRVIGNSQLYGIYEYGQETYTLGPLNGDGETLYEFIVQDLENETCASFTELEQMINCESGFVWPGDANFDNIADNFDLLNIGLAFGKDGPTRAAGPVIDSTDISTGVSWEPQEATDWDARFINGLNLKHADCNGDGVINEADVRVIQENYFFTHGTLPEKNESIGNETDPALYVDFPAISDIKSGEEFRVPIIFGTTNIPAEAYGLAFTIKFDPRVITDGYIDFTDSWMGDLKDLLTIQQNISSNGLIEVALTRKDRTNPFGAGVIGNFIVIIDDIEALTGESSIEVVKVQAVDKDGNFLAVHTPKTVLTSLTNTEDSSVDIEGGIDVFPNPTTDILTVKHKLEIAAESINIRSISGKFIQSVTPSQTEIPVNNLAEGVYLIEFKTANQTFYKKFVKQ